MKNAKGKSPAFQFYVKDWLSDPELQKAHPTTRGVWINLLCYMWDAPEKGKIETNRRELCHLGSCLPEDVELFLSDAKRLNFCDFFETCHTNVTDGHNDVTLKNRRMRRDEIYRIKARKRKQKQREKETEMEEKKASHTPVTQSGNHTPTPTPIPTPIPTANIKDKKKIYKRKMPDDFILTEKLRKYALDKNVPAHKIENMFEHFKNNHKGKGSVMLDWNSAWYTWVLSPYNKERTGGKNEKDPDRYDF